MVKSQKPKSAPTAGITSADEAREKAAQALVEKHPEGLPREPDPVKPEALPEVPPPAADPAGEVPFHRALGKTIQAQQDLPVGQPELTPDERAVLAGPTADLTEEECKLLALDAALASDPSQWPDMSPQAFQREVLCRMAAYQRGHRALRALLMDFVRDSRQLVEIALASTGGTDAAPSKPASRGLTPADLEGLAMAAEDKGQKAPSPEARRSWDELAKKCRGINASLRA